MVGSSVGETFDRARNGDRQAAEELVTRLSGMVVATVRKAGVLPGSTDDVAASVWLKLFEKADRVANPEAVAGWLRTTAWNESMQWHRKRKGLVLAATEDGFEVPVVDPGFENVEITEETQGRLSAIRAVWGGLNERCRKILALKTQEPRLTNKQVAVELGVPMGSVGPTYSRCLDRIRALLRGNDK